MSVTDPFSGWSANQDSNLPTGNQIPNTMDDELRNLKAEVKANVVDKTNAQTINGVKTFGSIPVGPTATDPTTDDQLARKKYVDNADAAEVTARNTAIGQSAATKVGNTGDETVDGVKTFSSIPVLPASDPTTGNQAARKAYVDSKVSVPPRAILQNRQAQNTGGGATTSGSWLIVPLNTKYEDANSIITATSFPAFSLAAGTYTIEAHIPLYQSNLHQTRLYNVTDSAVQQNVNSVAMYGQSRQNYSGAHMDANSIILGTFTITGTKQFRIEYQVQNGDSSGHGVLCNYGPEVYAQVIITKIA